MKGIMLMFSLVCVSLTAMAKDKNDVAKDKLKGKVKSIAITGYKMKTVNGKPEKDGIIFTSSSKYNELGSIQEFITSDINDSLDGEAVKFKAVRTEYQYNSEGTMTAKNDYNPNGTLEDSSFYVVDPKGSRVDWYTYKGNGKQEAHTISEYNVKGDLVDLTEYEKGKLKSKTTYVYDSKGNEIAETGFNDRNKVKWREEFKYNPAGQVMEVMDFDSVDALTGRFTYRYDTRGNMAEETEFYNDTSLRNKKTVTKYDLDGNPKEINHFNHNGRLVNQLKVDNMGLHYTDISYNDDASLKSVIAKKFDDKANQTFEDRFYTRDSTRTKLDYKLDYDSHGNWTRNTTTKNGAPAQMTERKIEYYTDPAEKKKKPGESK